MHVEVNEKNIALFELDKLTGNSREVLLSEAAQAAENGYILSCQIPDREYGINAFEHFESEKAPKYDGPRVEEFIEEHGGTVRAIVVDGEVIEGD